jgi:predicted nuclease of restriction endonuclease-like (RecB) superfamily
MKGKRTTARPVALTTGSEPADAVFQQLHGQIRELLAAARLQVRRSVNDAMVQTYWHVGRLIVEGEQGGQARAAYGQRTLPLLAERLTAEFGKGFSAQSLWSFRQFHLEFPNLSTAWRELSWSHYRLLMRVPDAAARRWYADEAASQGWSVRALDRQIGTLYYERLLSSQDKAAVQAEAGALIQAQAAPDPRDFIRDPYVLEFLGAQPGAALYEKDVEQGLLDQLHKFLLELGKGFAFVARQRHLRVENEDCFIDLVFYNYMLKCFVLVDLKVGKLAHQDVGQMDMYVRVFDGQMRQSGDNPTLGLILCSERNEAVARYSLLADSEQLFASRYRLWLPTEEELKVELERDRALIEAARAGEGGA